MRASARAHPPQRGARTLTPESLAGQDTLLSAFEAADKDRDEQLDRDELLELLQVLPRGIAALPPLPGALPCLSATVVTSPCTLSGGTAFYFFHDGCRRTRVLSPQRAHAEHLEHHGHASEAAPDDAFDLSPLAGN